MSVNRICRIVMMCLVASAIGSLPASPATAKNRGTTSPVCRGGSVLETESESEPVELAGVLEPAALSRFGVLRREAGPADQLPPLNLIGSRLGFELSSYYPGYIRQLIKLPDGSRYFVIPGFKHVPQLPPGQCLPKQLRHLSQPKPELLYCIAGIGSNVLQLSGSRCQTLAEMETGGDLTEPSFSSSFEVDLVPDGVATVRLVYRGGTVITAPVNENAFTFTPPQVPLERVKETVKRFGRTFEFERGQTHKHRRLTKRQRQRRGRAAIKFLERVLDELPPKQVQWLNAGGQMVRSFTPHRARNSLIIAGAGVVGSTGAVPVG